MNTSIVSCVGIALLATAGVARAELVANGGFEIGSLASWSTVNAGFASDYGTASAVVHTGVKSLYFAHPFGQDDQVYQTLATTSGSMYDLSFWVFNAQSGSDHLRVKWEGGIVFDQNPLSAPLGQWTQYTLSVTATQNGSELRIAGFDMPDRYYVDDVSVNAVPAPGAAVMIGAAGGVGLRRRRRVD